TRATTTRRRAPLRAAPGHPLRNRFGARLHGAHETARHSARTDMLGRAARSVSPCPAPEPLPALRAVTSVRSAVRQFRKCSVRRSRLAATMPQEIAAAPSTALTAKTSETAWPTPVFAPAPTATAPAAKPRK